MSAPDSKMYNLGDHPEFAALLGVMTASWSMLEYYLLGLFAAVMRSPPQRAQAAFYAIANNKARLDMIDSIIKDTTIRPSDRE